MKIVNKIIFIGLIGFIFMSCNNSSEREGLGLMDIIQGVWYYQERDTTYSEVIISDNIYWGYDDMFGVISYDYELNNSQTMKRFYVATHSPFSSLKINKFTNDTLWVTSESNYKFEMYRLNSVSEIDMIIKEDEVALDNYINGYRKRKLAWEKVHLKKVICGQLTFEPK